MARPAIDTPKGDFEQYQLPSPSGETSNISPSPTGSVLANGDFASPNFVSGSTGWRLDANGNFEAVNGTFSGTLGAVSLNVPDSTSTSSFHVDSNGNTWWGANVASGYAGAPAYVLATGAAHFENVEIGGTTIQYVITNSGIFSYGDGSDGNVTISANTSLSADMYYNNLTVDSAAVLNPAGFRIFVKDTLTLSGNAKISRNGSNGGSGGTSLADGYLKGAAASGAGGAGQVNGPGLAGGAGVSVTNALGSGGPAGQAGGDSTGTVRAGGAGGAASSATVSNVKLIANWHLATLLDVSSTGATVKFTNSGSAGGGGGGGDALIGEAGGTGGGGGGNGGIVAIYARSIVIASGSSITANAGNGGDGSNGNDGGGGFKNGNGGGGAGGNGGVIILAYNSLTNNGSLTATLGTGGSGGGAGGTGQTSATSGSSGVIYQFQLSL